MSKACVRLASFVVFVSVGCGASQGGSSGGDGVFGAGAKGGNVGGLGSGASGGAGYFPDMLMNGKGGGGTGSGPGTGDDKVCGQKNFMLNRLPPEILLVLDRSGSMRRDAQGAVGTMTNPDKWKLTTDAIDSTLASTEMGVDWGLRMFPAWKRQGDSPCGTAGIASVDPALNQHGPIKSVIDMNAPTLDKGATPTAKAMLEATAVLKARTTPNPKFLLLATDGLPNCKNDSDTQPDIDGAVAAVTAAQGAGFSTFVVGIAAAGIKVDGANPFDILNQMAVAGGKPLDGATKFYSAGNQQELTTALGTIAANAADCTFVLDMPPPSPTDVAVELDATRLGMSDWSYGAGNRSIVVGGTWCAKLKKGDIKAAQVKFGCPGKVIL